MGALIKSNDSILIAQRSKGALAGKWELPGGKIEQGETHESTLNREIHEELGATISVGDLIASVNFEVDSVQLCLHCY